MILFVGQSISSANYSETWKRCPIKNHKKIGLSRPAPRQHKIIGFIE
jgi:hypothetical protein